MKTMTVSKFKATCLSVLETVMKTGQPILITRQGKPLVQVIPPPPQASKTSWLGSCSDSAQIIGNIIKSVSDLEDWDIPKK